MEKLSVEELEELREKEFDERAERAERIQNTISLFRKIACVLAVMIAAAFIFFHVRKDYNNYAGSQLVTAEVINVEGASDKNISVTYRYNIAGKEYESNKVQYTEKIKKGDKKEIRVKKNNPEVILEYNDINFVVLLDVVIGLCLLNAVHNFLNGKIRIFYDSSLHNICQKVLSGKQTLYRLVFHLSSGTGIHC